ncbi:MAG: hypothetical protein P3W94_004770 [Paracoccus sp. (in: a-proteobacteria)]|nr:hypothetical protein [Paracoccus sp. (in: a-proteobacteria)]
MIGVVVWSNETREKAIIWCEDQATLAYLQGRENLADSRAAWPQPGDLVELDTQTIGNLRHALDVSLLSERGCPDLPRILSATATDTSGAAGDQAKLRLVASRETNRPCMSEQRPSRLPRTSAAG